MEVFKWVSSHAGGARRACLTGEEEAGLGEETILLRANTSPDTLRGLQLLAFFSFLAFVSGLVSTTSWTALEGFFWCCRVRVERFPPQMTWNSTMSSGYSSLEEDSEEYFFTARTSFFKKPSGKVTESKVNVAWPPSSLVVTRLCRLCQAVRMFPLKACQIAVFTLTRKSLKSAVKSELVLHNLE